MPSRHVWGLCDAESALVTCDDDAESAHLTFFRCAESAHRSDLPTRESHAHSRSYPQTAQDQVSAAHRWGQPLCHEALSPSSATRSCRRTSRSRLISRSLTGPPSARPGSTVTTCTGWWRMASSPARSGMCTSPRRCRIRSSSGARASALWCPPDAVVCDRHAGWLHGAEMVLAPGEHLALEPIRIFLPAGRGRLRNGLADSGERTFRFDDIVEIDGLRVTTPIRTAWDSVATGGRSVRCRPRSDAPARRVLRGGIARQGSPDSGATRWVTSTACDGTARGRPSGIAPRVVLRLRWIEVLVFRPTPQFEVWDGGEFLARLDLASEELRWAAEYDGDEWHSSPEQRTHDRARRELCEQRANWLITPFRKENLFGRHQNAERLLRVGLPMHDPGSAFASPSGSPSRRN